MFFAVLALALLAVIGLSYDVGGKYCAAENADWYAGQAARTGAQQINTVLYLSTGTLELAPQQAVAAADAYLNALAAQGVSGTATVTGTETVQVTITLTRPTAFLSLIGIERETVTATATAVLTHGVTGPEQ